MIKIPFVCVLQELTHSIVHSIVAKVGERWCSYGDVMVLRRRSEGTVMVRNKEHKKRHHTLITFSQ